MLTEIEEVLSEYPSVAIVVPAYNPKPVMLRRALHSCVEQSYPNLQIIVVDDGSSSEVAQTIDDIVTDECEADIIHVANSGVSHARNLGIERAKSDYIAFLDADDELAPGFVVSAVSAAKDYNLQLVMGAVSLRYEDKQDDCYLEFDADMVVYGPEEIVILRDYVLSYLVPKEVSTLRGLRRGPWAKLYSRELIANTRFDEALRYGEDAVFVADILEDATRVGIINSIWYYYYQYESSAVRTLNFDSSFFEHTDAIITHYRDYSRCDNSTLANITRYFFTTIDSIYSRSSRPSLHDMRLCLQIPAVHDAFMRVDLERYVVNQRTKWLYYCCRHGFAGLIAAYYRIMSRRWRVAVIK